MKYYSFQGIGIFSSSVFSLWKIGNFGIKYLIEIRLIIFFFILIICLLSSQQILANEDNDKDLLEILKELIPPKR